MNAGPHTSVRTLSGLSSIADHYDALFCDVWGVLHNGEVPFLRAADAIKRFRTRGPVVLITNSPRREADVEATLRRVGVPLDCYDAIVTSGSAAREYLIRRSSEHELGIFHIGPVRDHALFEGLNVRRTELAHADLVFCTEPYKEETETPANYYDLFSEMRTRGVTMICANPDLAIRRGNRLITCAGGLAMEYERLGGEVVYFGKPYAPIYEAAWHAAATNAGRNIANPLAVGDGVRTDIKGANRLNIDAVFIGDGVHASQVELTESSITALLAEHDARASAAMRSLVW